MADWQILQGDCLEIMPDIATGSIDMILCDLPYGVTNRNKWDVIIPFDKLWAQYKRIIKPNGAVVLTAIQPFSSMLVMSNLDWFKYEWIWEKHRGGGFLNAKKQPLRNHESILVFYDKPVYYSPQFTRSVPYYVAPGTTESSTTISAMNYGEYKNVAHVNEDGSRYPLTVQKVKHDTNKKHPTQKPLKLFKYLIKTYTQEEETVLDNCVGSGTTGMACVDLGRKFIGIELDPKWVAVARQRVSRYADGRLFP